MIYLCAAIYEVFALLFALYKITVVVGMFFIVAPVLVPAAFIADDRAGRADLYRQFREMFL